MAIKLSNRSDIETFRALDNLARVNSKISEGADIIRLEAGQPCFGAPEGVLRYAQDMIAQDPRQGYTDALGAQFLRERIAQYYGQQYGVELDYNRIAVTVGSSAGFIMAFLAAFDAGDTVALCTPTYAAYKNILKSVDLNVLEIQTNAETNFQPTAQLLEQYKGQFDGILVNSPSNPSGTILEESEFKNIVDWCADAGVCLFSDEAYHKITYETPAQTALKFSNDVIVLNTFSKYFAMTGWRLGWLIVPEDMVSRIKKLAESLFVSAPTISQHAAFKIFEHQDELDSYVDHYKDNRDILKKGLPEAGFDKISSGDGAFYLFVDISDYGLDSEEFCESVLEEVGVSVTSGKDFDPSRGQDFIRISYAGTPDDMKKACERLGRWVKNKQRLQDAAE